MRRRLRTGILTGSHREGRRPRIFTLDKRETSEYESANWMGLFIVLCVTMVLAIYGLTTALKKYGPHAASQAAKTGPAGEAQGAGGVPAKPSFLSRCKDGAVFAAPLVLTVAAGVALLLIVYRLTVNAATAAVPRRRHRRSEPLEVVPDEKVAEKDEAKDQTTEILDTSGQETKSKEKADEGKKGKEGESSGQ
jgi:hypothetical protein